jgi:hypothetical protein
MSNLWKIAPKIYSQKKIAKCLVATVIPLLTIKHNHTKTIKMTTIPKQQISKKKFYNNKIV